MNENIEQEKVEKRNIIADELRRFYLANKLELMDRITELDSVRVALINEVTQLKNRMTELECLYGLRGTELDATRKENLTLTTQLRELGEAASSYLGGGRSSLMHTLQDKEKLQSLLTSLKPKVQGEGGGK